MKRYLGGKLICLQVTGISERREDTPSLFSHLISIIRRMKKSRNENVSSRKPFTLSFYLMKSIHGSAR